MNKEQKAKKTEVEYKQICDEMIDAGYQERVHILQKSKTIVIGILLSLILTIIMGLIYRVLNGATTDFELNYPLFLLIAVVSIVIHEFIHGLGWSISCKQGWKSIDFGLNGIMPYCHCKEALDSDRYLLGVLMPFLVLGLVIAVIAFIFSNMWLVLTAVVNIFLAGGDLLIAFYLRKNPKAKIIDHPTDPGFIAFEKKN